TMLFLPGVIDSTTNVVEHSEVVADRIAAAVAAVGDRTRVLASVDCGFGTFAGSQLVEESVVWAKLRTLRQGADLATKRLGGWARLTLADARGDELARTVADVRGAGGEAASVVADLARPEDCASVVAAAVGAGGRLDVVFNNAGVGTMTVGGTVETIELDKWDLALDVNVRAMYLVSRAAVPALRGAGGGSIIN